MNPSSVQARYLQNNTPQFNWCSVATHVRTTSTHNDMYSRHVQYYSRLYTYILGSFGQKSKPMPGAWWEIYASPPPMAPCDLEWSAPCLWTVPGEMEALGFFFACCLLDTIRLRLMSWVLSKPLRMDHWRMCPSMDIEVRFSDMLSPKECSFMIQFTCHTGAECLCRASLQYYTSH